MCSIIYQSLSNFITWFGDIFISIISNPIWKTHSSYNLGVAITAIAIVVTFIEFMLNKRELRFSLNYKKRRIALWLGIWSIFLVFLGELDGLFLGYPFIFEISGAIFMIIAIAIYLYVILNPLKRINKEQILILRDVLVGTLSNSQTDKSQTIRGCVELFDNLLEVSLESEELKNIFKNDFTSEVFLKHFSESYVVFGRTIDFYVEKMKEGSCDLYHIEFFLKQLMIKSLENNDSFLNIFIGQKVYPNALFCLDDVMINEKKDSLLQTLFGDYKFNGLDFSGQLNYIALATRYFRLVYEKNNHVSVEDGYQKNYELNDKLVCIFFKQIIEFVKRSYDQKQLEIFLDKVEGFSWYYEWGVKTKDKSIEVRKKAGNFLYDFFYNFISKYEIENEEVFRLKTHLYFDHFLEMQQNGCEDNIAYNAFVIKLKEKILGEGKDGVMPNFRGYFPSMLLVYFYMFSFQKKHEN